MDIRAQHRAATREQIIEAVHDVLTEESPATLSMPRVAARAGTSLRTLYRYFPTKEALIDAASQSFEVSPAQVGGRIGLDNLAEYLRIQWSQFSSSVAAVRAQHMTPAGRAMRDRRLPRQRAGVRAELAEHVDLPEHELDLLTDLVVAALSSSMYLELVDRLGHAEDEAARLAAFAVNAIVDHAKHEGAISR
jgi:AcrR family transcriptional regulator